MKFNKKTKFTVAISLIVQSVSFVIMFFILAGKKKSFAKAFLAMASVGGIAGTAFLCSYLKEDRDDMRLDEDDFVFDEIDCFGDDSDCLDECDCADCGDGEASAAE